MSDADSAQQDRLLEVETFVAKLGDRVRRMRERQGLSRRVLSEKSAVSMRYLAQLEGGEGNISIGLLLRVAKALDCRIECLVADASDLASDEIALIATMRAAPPAIQAQVRALLAYAEAPEGRARRICLIGLRGAGKSTLGPVLAARLGFPFLELNREIESLSGMAVDELMGLYGLEGYRRLEREALQSILERSSDLVLAVAGGIVSDAKTYGFLLQNFHAIWLKAAPEEHMQRVRAQGDERPMAGNPRAMDELKSILLEREALYGRAAIMVDTSNKSLEESREDLFAAVDALALF